MGPTEIYNLAAQSHVKVSFEIPDYTGQVDALGTLRFLDGIRETGLNVRFYQASTSELFGNSDEIPQTEQTPFRPRSPYAVAKLYGYWILDSYREAYGLHASNGILFNHESPRRGETFVTRKISLAVARISKGMQEILRVGNLYAKRDWGYAPEYVEGMWLMLQQDHPDDYVLATGECHTVKEFVDSAFSVVGIELDWVGEGTGEKGIERKTGKERVVVDPRYYRPSEVHHLMGDPSKAENILNWKASMGFERLVRIMVEADLEKIDRTQTNR